MKLIFHACNPTTSTLSHSQPTHAHPQWNVFIWRVWCISNSPSLNFNRVFLHLCISFLALQNSPWSNDFWRLLSLWPEIIWFSFRQILKVSTTKLEMGIIKSSLSYLKNFRHFHQVIEQQKLLHTTYTRIK